jgi:transcriptional regulator with PAS, ATPase and Fis domain
MRRVGSVAERRVKVRVIAATNRDLEQEVANKMFREDLYYRINVLGIELPPLRRRIGDIELLAREFAGQEWEIDDDVIARINSYSWPGNVRQLQNAIERAKVLAEHNRIEVKNLPSAIVHADRQSNASITGSDLDLETLNKLHVAQTYEQCGRNKTKTAKALGINRRSFYRLLEKFDIK